MPDLRGLLSRIGSATDTARDNIMPTPAGLGGLLDPNDVAAARRQGLLAMGSGILGSTGNIFQNLAHGMQAGQEGYSGALESTLKNKAYAQSQGDDQVRRQQMHNIMAARASIAQKYAAQPGETPEQGMAKLPAMLNDYLQAGDLESVKAIEGIVSKQAEDKPDTELQTVGNASNLIDKRTGRVITSTPIHPTDEAIANMQAQRSQAASNAQMAADNHAMRVQQQEDSQGMQAERAFRTENAQLIKSETAFSSWKAALAAARSGDPTAYKSALINFAGAADANAQLRLGTIQYLSKVDPSIAGNFQLGLEKLAKGAYPQKVLDGMDRLVTSIHKGNVNLYETRRAGRIKAHPSWDKFITPTSEIFATPTDSSPQSRDLTPFMGGRR